PFVDSRDRVAERVRAVDVEHTYRQGGVAAQGEGASIHDRQAPGDHLVETQRSIAFRGGVFLRVLVVDAVHAGGLDQHLAAAFDRAQGGGGVGGEQRVAGTAAEDDDVAPRQRGGGRIDAVGLDQGADR